VPGLIALATSGLKLYPFQGRLLLFTLPLASVVLASGFVQVWTWVDGRVRARTPLVLVSVLLAVGAFWVGARAKWQDQSNLIDTRSLMEAVGPMVVPGDTVWVSGGLHFSKEVYAQMLDIEVTEWIDGGGWLPRNAGDVERERVALNADRIWVLTPRPRGNDAWLDEFAARLAPGMTCRVVRKTRATALLCLERPGAALK
jgi:hypothetical protein